MKSNKSKTSAAAITFYVISVILLAVFAFNIYYSYTNVATYLESYQMSFADEWKMFLSSYFQQCIPSFVGAIVCYGIAAILVKLENTNQALIACFEEASAPKEKTETKETVVTMNEETVEVKKEEKKPAAKKASKAKKEEKVTEAKDSKTVDVKTKDVKVKETKKEEVKAEEVKKEETKAEETKAEEKKA